MSAPALPKLLRMIADEAGMEAAVRAAQALGGKRIYISCDPKPGDPLVLTIGLEAARAVGDVAGGDAIEFPRGAANLRYLMAAQLVEDKASANQMAVALKSTYRWARELRKRIMDGRPVKIAHRPRQVDPRQTDIETHLRQR